MTTDFTSMMNAGPREAAALKAEQDEADWAAYGRTVHHHLLTEGAIERIITTIAMRTTTTTKDIARAIRVYLTTGAMP